MCTRRVPSHRRGEIYTIGSDPYKFALTKNERELYVADPDSGMVLVFSYITGSQIGTIYKGLTSALGALGESIRAILSQLQATVS